MKLSLINKNRRIRQFPESIKDLKQVIERKLLKPNELRQAHSSGLKIWEGLEFYYVDSENDQNVISEEEDLRDAKKYKQLKNYDYLNCGVKLKEG